MKKKGQRAIIQQIDPNLLHLNRAEVESIQSYIWQHVRATNGTAFKTWEKMWEFLQREPKAEVVAEPKLDQPILF